MEFSQGNLVMVNSENCKLLDISKEDYEKNEFPQITLKQIDFNPVRSPSPKSISKEKLGESLTVNRRLCHLLEKLKEYGEKLGEINIFKQKKIPLKKRKEGEEIPFYVLEIPKEDKSYLYIYASDIRGTKIFFRVSNRKMPIQQQTLEELNKDQFVLKVGNPKVFKKKLELYLKRFSELKSCNHNGFSTIEELIAIQDPSLRRVALDHLLVSHSIKNNYGQVERPRLPLIINALSKNNWDMNEVAIFEPSNLAVENNRYNAQYKVISIRVNQFTCIHIYSSESKDNATFFRISNEFIPIEKTKYSLWKDQGVFTVDKRSEELNEKTINFICSIKPSVFGKSSNMKEALQKGIASKIKENKNIKDQNSWLLISGKKVERQLGISIQSILDIHNIPQEHQANMACKKLAIAIKVEKALDRPVDVLEKALEDEIWFIHNKKDIQELYKVVRDNISIKGLLDESTVKLKSLRVRGRTMCTLFKHATDEYSHLNSRYLLAKLCVHAFGIVDPLTGKDIKNKTTTQDEIRAREEFRKLENTQ